MGHKVPAYANRLGINEYWKSKWFFKKNYRVFLEADFLIRKIIFDKFKNAFIVDVFIERKDQEHCKVIIKTSRPGIIIGRDGQRLKRLQEELRRRLLLLFDEFKIPNPSLEISVEEIKKPTLFASFNCKFIASEIEKNKSVRSVMKKTIERIRQNKEVEGVKIRVSGRIGGANIHRTETITWGRMPLSKLKAKIDYSFCEALTKYGIIGIKVWIYKGDISEIKEEI